jgi:hypothetical protein
MLSNDGRGIVDRCTDLFLSKTFASESCLMDYRKGAPFAMLMSAEAGVTTSTTQRIVTDTFLSFNVCID